MNYRFSIVDRFNLRSLAFSSVLEIGDSNQILPYSIALAVQREEEIFYGHEGHFNFPLFLTLIPRPLLSEQIQINRINESSEIHVHSVNITAASVASVIHIGSTNLIEGESWIKHIRHLSNVEEEAVEEAKAQQEAQQLSGS
ncbi:MAG TPA: spore germination protein GerPE [Bacillales bacterium]|nr:spore germination protein GerPE [Bacillales bacterium]